MQAQIEAELALAEQNRPKPEEIEAHNHEMAKNARAKMFYIYRPITVKELKVGQKKITFVVCILSMKYIFLHGIYR